MKWTLGLGLLGLIFGVFLTNVVAHATGKVHTFIAIVCMAVVGSIGRAIDRSKQPKK